MKILRKFEQIIKTISWNFLFSYSFQIIIPNNYVSGENFGVLVLPPKVQRLKYFWGGGSNPSPLTDRLCARAHCFYVRTSTVRVQFFSIFGSSITFNPRLNFAHAEGHSLSAGWNVLSAPIGADKTFNARARSVKCWKIPNQFDFEANLNNCPRPRDDYDF